MPPTVAASQVGRRRAGPKCSERLTLAVTPYERQAVRKVAMHRGLIIRLESQRGQTSKGAGASLLRTMSLEQIVAEYRRLRASGEIAA